MWHCFIYPKTLLCALNVACVYRLCLDFWRSLTLLGDAIKGSDRQQAAYALWKKSNIYMHQTIETLFKIEVSIRVHIYVELLGSTRFTAVPGLVQQFPGGSLT